jgi:hypothetical protein
MMCVLSRHAVEQIIDNQRKRQVLTRPAKPAPSSGRRHGTDPTRKPSSLMQFKRGISGEGEGTPDAVPLAEETVSA